jgi:hypothetical protein
MEWPSLDGLPVTVDAYGCGIAGGIAGGGAGVGGRFRDGLELAAEPVLDGRRSREFRAEPGINDGAGS